MSEDTNTNNDDIKTPLKEDMDVDVVNADVDLDDSKAKFLNGGKGIDDEVVVEVPEAKSATEFQGLSKDELMQYVNDPFWKRMRIIFFVLFWVGWLIMLVAAIIIIVLAPRCPSRPDLKWYNTESVYNVFVKSYMDADGDGIGDLKGLKSKVSYVQSLGAKTISIGSVYKTDEFGAVVDHKDIDLSIGTLKDIEDMLKEYKKLGPKIIMDFIPNHTSRNHTWFLESRKSKDNDFADYYIWADADAAGKNGGAPNNWRALKGKSAWVLDPVRNQYFLGQKGAAYPDLNLKSEKVREELEGILRFWLDRLVGGFNVLDVGLLVENATLDNERVIGTGNFYDDLDHSMTLHNADNIEVLNFFRKIVDQYSDKPGRERVLYALVTNTPDNITMTYYGTDTMPALHIVVGEKLYTKLDKSCGATCVKTFVDSELANSESVTQWFGWMCGNEATSRVGVRMGDAKAVSAVVLQLTLPGTPFMYYGDEVGMTNGPSGQYKYQTPMQWSPDENAGFTVGNPWIDVNSDFMINNVGSEESHFRKSSILSKVKELLELRTSESFQFGATTTGVDGDIFWFVRSAPGFPPYLVAINFGNSWATHLFKTDLFSETAVVKFHSHQEFTGDAIDIRSTYVSLDVGEAVIMQLS